MLVYALQESLIVDVHGDAQTFSMDHSLRELPWGYLGAYVDKGLPYFSVVFREETSTSSLSGVSLAGEKKASGIGPREEKREGEREIWCGLWSPWVLHHQEVPEMDRWLFLLFLLFTCMLAESENIFSYIN